MAESGAEPLGRQEADEGPGSMLMEAAQGCGRPGDCFSQAGEQGRREHYGIKSYCRDPLGAPFTWGRFDSRLPSCKRVCVIPWM